jgi:hypothetical protein
MQRRLETHYYEGRRDRAEKERRARELAAGAAVKMDDDDYVRYILFDVLELQPPPGKEYMTKAKKVRAICYTCMRGALPFKGGRSVRSFLALMPLF